MSVVRQRGLAGAEGKRFNFLLERKTATTSQAERYHVTSFMHEIRLSPQQGWIKFCLPYSLVIIDY